MRINITNEDEQADLQEGQVTKLSTYEVYLLSAALCSKDSFAAPIMVDHHKLSSLHSLVFGEGIINDATSLALF